MADTTNLVKLLDPAVKATFFKQYADTPIMWNRIATEVESSKDIEAYAWLGSSPAMREWTDERQPAGLKEYNFTVTNLTYENSIAVKRSQLEDDQKGQIMVRVQELAMEARKHTDRSVITKLAANGLCYDGQNFIDTDHSEEASGSQSNKGTTALALAEYGVARAAMMGFKDTNGTVQGIIPDLMLVPPALEQTGRQILTAEMISDATTTISNTWRGTAELMVSPFLTDTNNWYLMYTKGVVKPMLVQTRTPVEFGRLEKDSDEGFMRDRFIYGTRERKAFAVGQWRFCYGEIVS